MNIKKLIRTINDKRVRYLNMYHQMPNRIHLSNKQILELQLHFMYIMNPAMEMKTLCGMVVIPDDDIKKFNDIKVY